MGRYIVLTGDIIASTALAADDLDAILKRISKTTGQYHGAQFARRGGDAWQSALPCPANALHLALSIQAHVMSDDANVATRLSIAVGDGTIPANGDLNAAHGDAFTRSGRGLGTLTETTRICDTRGGAHHAAALLADHIAQGWTRTQARAMAAALAPDAPTQASIADRLGVTRQSVNQTLRAAGFPALSNALHALGPAQ